MAVYPEDPAWIADGYLNAVQKPDKRHPQWRTIEKSIGDLHLIYTSQNEYLIDADGEPIVWSD